MLAGIYEEDTLVEIQMAERGTHGNIALIRTTKRRSRTIEELAARAATEWWKGGALELALCGPLPVVWHIGCLFFLLLALVSRITSGKKVSRCHQGTVYTHPGGEVNVTESEASEPGAGNKYEAAANWPAEREQSEGIEVSETARTNSTTTIKAKKSSNKDEYNQRRRPETRRLLFRGKSSKNFRRLRNHKSRGRNSLSMKSC